MKNYTSLHHRCYLAVKKFLRAEMAFYPVEVIIQGVFKFWNHFLVQIRLKESNTSCRPTKSRFRIPIDFSLRQNKLSPLSLSFFACNLSDPRWRNLFVGTAIHRSKYKKPLTFFVRNRTVYRNSTLNIVLFGYKFRCLAVT